VRQNGYALQFSASGLQDDREVVFSAVLQNSCASVLRYASEALRSDRSLALECVALDSYAVALVSLELRQEASFVREAVDANPLALKYTSQEFKADREVVLAAVRGDGRALKFASARLRSDESVVRAAVEANWQALAFVATYWQADRGLVLGAVRAHWGALAHANRWLREDAGIALAAVAQDARALEHCGPVLSKQQQGQGGLKGQTRDLVNLFVVRVAAMVPRRRLHVAPDGEEGGLAPSEEECQVGSSPSCRARVRVVCHLRLLDRQGVPWWGRIAQFLGFPQGTKWDTILAAAVNLGLVLPPDNSPGNPPRNLPPDDSPENPPAGSPPDNPPRNLSEIYPVNPHGNTP